MPYRPWHATVSIVLFASATAVTSAADAQRDRALELAPSMAAAGYLRAADRGVSLEQAVAIVRSRTGGRILDARAEGNGYRIKVLTPRGDVIVVFVDARTGDTR